MPSAIKPLLNERAAQENTITKVKVSETTITVRLIPTITLPYERPDCQEAVAASYHDRATVTIQGLGIQGKALRYQVTTVRLGYLNDAGEFKTFTAPIPGIRAAWLATDEVVDKLLYFHVDRNLSLADSVQLLHDVYGVHTSVSAVARWKKGAAAALPAVGQLIQMLNEKQPITALHLNEYKATGTKSWELATRDRAFSKSRDCGIIPDYAPIGVTAFNRGYLHHRRMSSRVCLEGRSRCLGGAARWGYSELKQFLGGQM